MSADEGIKTAARIDIGSPRRFTPGAVLIVSAFGLVSTLPIFVAILVMSLLSGGILTFLTVSMGVLLLAVGVGAFLLPFGSGNPYVARLVRSFHPATGAEDEQGFIVQLQMSPRLRTGLRALAEDADDVGYLSFSESALVYHGDSVRLSIPFERILRVEARNIGLRGMYLYGPRIALEVSGLPNVDSLEFTERSSWLLPGSRKTARAMYDRLRAAAPRGSGTKT
jgi:hypothetical protein